MRKMYERAGGADFTVCRRCAGNDGNWNKGLCNSHWRRERIRCNKYKPYHITYRRGGVIETYSYFKNYTKRRYEHCF